MTNFLQEFSKEKLEESRKQWIHEANALNYPTIDIEKVFTYALNHLDYKKVNNDSLSYTVFCEESNDCLAVVDVIVSNNNPQKTYIKMLQVDLCPKYIDILLSDRMEQIDLVIDVYVKATLGTILLTTRHKADIVKLYGRTKSMKLLLKSMESSINTNEGFKGSTNWEGNWLTIKPTLFKMGAINEQVN